MKFHGVDMQGKLQIQELGSLPSYVNDAQDGRRIFYVTGDAYYFGDVNLDDFIKIQVDDGGTPITTITDYLVANYHPKNGDAAETMTASTYSGDGAGEVVLRATDTWVKVSATNPVTTGQSGIMIEYGVSGETTTDEDPRIYFDGSASSGEGWRIANVGYTAFTSGGEAIATRTWVNSLGFVTDLTGIYDKDSSNARFLQLINDFSDYQEIGITTTGDVTVSSDLFYVKDWVDDNLVTYITEDGSPAGSCVARIAESAGNYSNAEGAWNVVRRNSIGDIYANVGHLTATSAYYADLAEKYTCDETLPVGTVVGVTSSSEYEVGEYDFDTMPNVIGVVSRNPAFLMNSDSEGLPIALAGKVEVRVVGEVKKGDFLVPSTVVKGTARKGNPSSQIDTNLRFATVLETSLQTEERLVYCIVK